MRSLILAGGKGTRLRPLTVYTPKPIVPVANRPLLLYQIDLLRNAGITDVTLSLSYQPDKIEQVIGNGSDEGVNLRYITEPNPLGTGGAYKYAADTSDEPTIVFNGDILTDIDLSGMIAFHKERNAQATIALAPVDDPARYGVAKTDSESRILNFVEKPSAEQLGELTNTINAGIYILEPSILELIASDTNRSFEYHVFPEILEKGLPFYGYVMKDNYWLDIGTPESYLRAHLDLIAGKLARVEIERQFNSDVATHAEIDRSSVVGEGCVVKPSASISNSVIGPGVHIEEKAAISDSVIWSHTRIASSAEVTGSVIGRSCHIGRNAIVGPGSVLGDKTSLTDYTRV
jgi:NDP-sugar pyrophosphorylase family protein